MMRAAEAATTAAGQALDRLDWWQRSKPIPAVVLAVIKKFGDDRLNRQVVGLGWYGFVAIYPMLLVAVSVLGFIGAPSLGQRLVNTLHQFPVVGPEFNPAHGGAAMHGSTAGLVIGLLGLLYGSLGVTQTATDAMVTVWNIPAVDAPGYLERLARSLVGVVVIGSAFVVNAAVATYATGGSVGYAIGVPVVLAMVLGNAVLYGAAFRALTPGTIPLRSLVPGAAAASVGFTVLITLGSGLVQHQVRHSSVTYGQFGVVIGLVAFLFLLAKITLYAAEVNPVLDRRLWPRGLRSAHPTAADNRMLRALAHQSVRRADEKISVELGASDSPGRPSMDPMNSRSKSAGRR